MAAEDKDMNRDPLTSEPGAHPIGTAVGSTGGAVAGAAAGILGGPVGMAVGGVVGAVVGGLAGKAAAEAVNPTAEESHWRENYTKEPYYERGRSFDDYGPAYRHGMNARLQHEGEWDTVEPKLASEWSSARSGSGLEWHQAQPASRAAWDRVDALRGGYAGQPAGGLTGSSGAMGSDTAVVRANDLAAGNAGTSTSAGWTADTQMDSSYGTSGRTAAGSTGVGGVAAKVGEAQSAGNTSGDTGDVIDALQDLVECCKDGEYGFRECAEQAKRQDLKTLFLQRADSCRQGAEELNQQIRSLGGSPEHSGSAGGALHRGWVSVRAALTTYDDKAVLEECERGEDNALARYRKALKQPLPGQIKEMVERQYQGVQRNHDQIKMLRDQARAAT
jgi:uncharacterized protein (TIGR02284 family)